MATFTVRPEGITRTPALTMPGNATGSEAACTALTGSQIRALCGLGTTDSPTFGGMTLNGHVLMSPTNTYDVGNGTYDPRTVRAATSVLSPLFNNPAAAATTLGNSTYGVTVPGKLSIGRSPSGSTTALDVYNASAAVLATIQSGNNFCELLLTSGNSGIPNYIASNGNLSFYIGGSERLLISQSTGAATFTGDISMSKTSAQGYVRAYSPNGTKQSYFYTDNTGLSKLVSAHGQIWFEANGSDYAMLSDGSSNGYFRVFSTSNRAISVTHNNTNGEIGTSSGNLNLVPGGGTVAVTGILTSSSYTSASAYWCDGSLVLDTSGTTLDVGGAGGFTALRLGNNAGAAGLQILLGNGAGSTAAPMLKIAQSATTVQFRRADDTVDAALTCAGITASGVVSHGAYTVATLPAAGSNAGKMAQVTDSNVAASGNYGATVAAGGSNRVKVFSDGTNWVIA